MGLTNWKGEIITREQAQIAKNYLQELELKRLNEMVAKLISAAISFFRLRLRQAS